MTDNLIGMHSSSRELCLFRLIIGGADALALKIDSIVDGCKFSCLKTAAGEGTNAHLEGQPLPHYTDVKFTDAVIYRKSPCQVSSHHEKLHCFPFPLFFFFWASFPVSLLLHL